jgi:hypothetical protein
MSLSDSIENARTGHPRHRKGWGWAFLVSDDHTEPDVPASERDPRAVRWLCLALGAFWVGLVVWVVAA